MFQNVKSSTLGSKNSNYNYTMGGRVLDVVDSEKDVGVTIHKSLKPSLQCARAASKANLVLGQLARAVIYRDRTFIRLYQMYVRPPSRICSTELVPLECGRQGNA